MTTTSIGTSLTAVTHVLHVRHALTQEPPPGLRATLVPPTAWWVGSRTTPAGDVAVFAADTYPAGPAPVVRLSITDAATSVLVVSPVVEVTLDAPELTHVFEPVPQTLTVALVTRADGSPRTGRTVRAVPAGGGGAVALPEVPGTPGAYQSALRTWAAADATFDLEVDGHPVDRFTLDPFRLDTRLHAVSPA